MLNYATDLVNFKVLNASLDTACDVEEMVDGKARNFDAGTANNNTVMVYGVTRKLADKAEKKFGKNGVKIVRF